MKFAFLINSLRFRVKRERGANVEEEENQVLQDLLVLKDLRGRLENSVFLDGR
jgi:hypothetical protein